VGGECPPQNSSDNSGYLKSLFLEGREKQKRGFPDPVKSQKRVKLGTSQLKQ
jgi:hypothetical protein